MATVVDDDDESSILITSQNPRDYKEIDWFPNIKTSVDRDWFPNVPRSEPGLLLRIFAILDEYFYLAAIIIVIVGIASFL